MPLTCSAKKSEAKKVKRRMQATNLSIITLSSCPKKEGNQRLRIWQGTLRFAYSHGFETLTLLLQTPSCNALGKLLCIIAAQAIDQRKIVLVDRIGLTFLLMDLRFYDIKSIYYS
jgi:hypothetical protein